MERRVLVINPNRDIACTAGIERAVAPFARPGFRFETTYLPDGPAAVATWRDWFSVALPLCDFVVQNPADAYVIACVSDPGLDAIREVTGRPVLGPFRCAIAAALARADRFGVIAFVDASKARQRRILQAMGTESRLAATEALNLPMTTLTDGSRAREALIAAALRLVAAGAGAVILGCAGMAHHRRAVEDVAGVPVIEPMAAAAAAALAAIGESAESGTPQRVVDATA